MKLEADAREAERKAKEDQIKHKEKGIKAEKERNRLKSGKLAKDEERLLEKEKDIMKQIS